MDVTRDVIAAALRGRRPAPDEALLLAEERDLGPLVHAAAAIRDAAHGPVISYSRKVFIPLTKLCRDVCGYCTFAHPPRPGESAYLTRDEVLEIARAGARAGCTEALFTLGDKPELRYEAVRRELALLGHATTISYLAEVAGLVLEGTGLLPHANPGVMTADEIAALRRVTASQGIMLESISPRLLAPGGPHHGAPDKEPALRLRTIRDAGELRVPFTSGILIGIGETRLERVESLLALRDLHDRYGHIQEVIVQNFRAKPGTRMAGAPEPDLDELRWTIAVARLVLGPAMNIQAPPNLSPGAYRALIAAGLNDWGGVSPVTIDHVNPEAPWPELAALEAETVAAGKVLVPRLPAYPSYVAEHERWIDPAVAPHLIRASDSEGFARADAWSPGLDAPLPRHDLLARPQVGTGSREIRQVLARVVEGVELDEDAIALLFTARGPDATLVCRAADELRRAVRGEEVTYVVNRNINYTNVCSYRCQFCAFSKGKLSESLRGKPYDLDLGEIVRRAQEAWARGATEVCMQGGIHPEYTGETYLRICRAVTEAVPGIHVHAFSPLEVWQGAATLGVSIEELLGALRDAGLGSLPGTAAEILDDEVRERLCPDKIRTAQWLEVVGTAHRAGLRTTATIMFGHLERPRSWARHLVRVRELQRETGGITEFVPLPFVHMEAPVYLKGQARKGPTFRETVLMHAVARLALHPHITSIQVSWVKMGPEGAKACLEAGANDLGGTLMNESITRAAGGNFGQELAPAAMQELIRSIGRVPRQRTTLYGAVSDERQGAVLEAAPLAPVVLTPARRYERAHRT